MGYAPVLVAIAESLAVANPHAIVSHEKTMVGLEGHSDLLREIVNQILERESVKLRENLADKLQALLPVTVEQDIVAGDLYSAAEQIARVAARVLDLPIVTPLPISLPAEIREVYESHVGQFVADHPFVRGSEFSSTVFQDHVYAEILCNPAVSVSLQGFSVESLVKPGPFFLEFYANSAGRFVAENCIPMLIDSWAADVELSGSGAAHSVLVDLVDDGGLMLVPLRSSGDYLELRVGDRSAALVLSRVPSDVLIASDQGIVLDAASRPILLGRRSAVVAAEIEIVSQVVSVIGQGAGAAFLIAEGDLTANFLTSVEATAETLKVKANEVPPRLREYVWEVDGSPGVRLPVSMLVDLRALLAPFRSTVHFDGLSAERDAVERIVRRGSDRERILGRLVDEGVIRAEEGFYILDSTSLGQVGFSLNDVKNCTRTPEIAAFLTRCQA